MTTNNTENMIDTTTPETAHTDTENTTAETTDTGTTEAEEGGKEAAKYRRRLRDTEAERDQLKIRMEATQKAMADQIAETAGRIKPAALWASGVTLADLTDDDGNVDRAKVIAAADNAAKVLGLARTLRPDPSQGMGGGGRMTTSFTDAFRP